MHVVFIPGRVKSARFHKFFLATADDFTN